MRRLTLGLLLVLPVFCQTNPNAKLLFKSGFENATYIDPIYDGSYSIIRGTDQSTGYTWPITAFNPNPQLSGIQNVISTNQSTYLGHAIETVPGPYGNATSALLLKLKSQALSLTCCIQAALQTASLGDDVRDVYARYWTKMNPEFLSQAKAATTNFWRMTWEMKTFTDYRITPMIYADSTGTPYWYIKADNNPSGCTSCQTFWTITNKTVPVPGDRWFLMEFYVHRSSGSDGRVFWGVDGQTIADHWGPNIGASNEKFNVIMYKNLYGPDNAFPMYEWMDDLEIWNVPPCTNLPCGAPPSGGGSSDTQAPTVPTNFTASATSSSQISLSWSASSDNIGVAGYRLYRNGATTPVATVTSTSYLDTGLAAGATYTYTVSAYDAAGNVSGSSSPASATTASAATPTPTPTTPDLVRGSIPSSSTTLYSPNYITDGDYTLANVGGAGSGVQWIQFDLGQVYTLDSVKVWHYADGRTYHDVIVQVSNDANFGSGVTTVFNNDSDNSAGQGVGTQAEYPESSTGLYVPISKVDARYVRLWSNGSTMNVWNHYGEVEVYGSAAVQADTQAPTTPQNLKASAASSSQISLSWTGSTDNIGVAGYRIYRNGATTPLASVSGTAYQDTGLAPSTTDTYTVAAYDGAGNVSAQSASATATTAPLSTAPVQNLARGRTVTGSTTLSNANYITDGDYTLANVGGAGSGVQWIQIDLGQTYALDDIKVWHYADGRTYHDVIVQVSNDANFASGVTTVFNNDADNSAGQGAGADAEYPDLTTGKEILFQPVNARYVRLWSNGSTMNAWNHYGEVEVYGSANTTDTTAPSIPTGVSATAISSSQVNLTWSASTDNTGVAGYRIYRNAALVATVTSGTSYSDSNLAASSSYSYQVAAFDAAGNSSALSTSVSVTTPQAAAATSLSVNIVSPANNTTIRRGTTVQFAANVTGSAVSVRYRVDGVVVATGTAPTFSATWIAVSANNGWKILDAVATDAAGNTATSPGLRIRMQ